MHHEVIIKEKLTLNGDFIHLHFISSKVNVLFIERQMKNTGRMRTCSVNNIKHRQTKVFVTCNNVEGSILNRNHDVWCEQTATEKFK